MSNFLKALSACKGDQTLAEMGKALDVSPSALSRILRGHSSISSDILRRIFLVYPDLYPIWLRDGSGDQTAAAA